MHLERENSFLNIVCTLDHFSIFRCFCILRIHSVCPLLNTSPSHSILPSIIHDYLEIHDILEIPYIFEISYDLVSVDTLDAGPKLSFCQAQSQLAIAAAIGLTGYYYHCQIFDTLSCTF